MTEGKAQIRQEGMADVREGVPGRMGERTIFGNADVTKDDVPKSEYQLPAYEQEPLAIMWPNWPGGSESMEIERLYLDARGRIVLQGAPVRETLQKLEADCNKLL